MAHDDAPPVQYSVTSTILMTVGVTVILYYVYQFLRERKWNYPPGPTGIPIFGSMLSLVFTKKQQHELIDEWSHRYGPLFSFKLLTARIFVLGDIGLVQEVYQNPDINERMSFAANAEIMGRQNCGIGTSNGNVWKEQRRFFMTVFKKVDVGVIRFEEIISTQTERFIAEVEKHKGESFDPQGLIKIAAANVITRIITGVNYEYDDPKFGHMIDCTCRALDLIGPAGLFALIPVLATVPSPTKTEIIRLIKEIVKMINRSIESHRADFNPSEPASDFIGCYLKEMADRSSEADKSTFDDVNLLASSVDALVPGWETNSTTLSWILFLVASHPEAQDRVRREISEVVGDGRLTTFADRHKMPVSVATIAECMRLRPPSAFNLPHVAAKDCKIGSYDLPKGSVVMTNIWYLNLSPNLWDQPRVFRPTRFLDEKGAFNKSIEPYPFGYGPRVCPGEQLARMEIFLFTTHILQHFKLTLPDGATRTNLGKHGLTNRPDPYKVHAIKIQ